MALIFDDLFVDGSLPLPVPKPELHMKHFLIGGELVEWHGPFATVRSPVCPRGSAEGFVIGSFPLLTEREARAAVDAAQAAFDGGRGAWPQSSPKDRIAAVEHFMAAISKRKKEIVDLIMWEICKPWPDAEKEFDRTVKYVEDTIKEYKTLLNREVLAFDSGFVAKIRRVPLGVCLCSSPTNYPYNELYTTFIPALLLGNCIVIKLPRIGGLCHGPTLQALRDSFPRGAVNVVPGAGRTVMAPMMASGLVDAFAFIGSTHAAGELLKLHPKPNRLRLCLGLEAKNPAIVFADADLRTAVAECVVGSLSFNGMRCTALKIIYVHSGVVAEFLRMLVTEVDRLKMGMPWDGSKITPLCESKKDIYLQGLIDDAVEKGARVANERGAKFDRTLVSPTVLYPVTRNMKVFHEEQFGPVVPVLPFSDIEEVFTDLRTSDFGQQASVFSQDPETIGKTIDVLAHYVSRVNINGQCQRGPDVFPFTARKDSATATLSVNDALRTFSIRAMVAAKETPENHEIMTSVVKGNHSQYMSFDYLM